MMKWHEIGRPTMRKNRRKRKDPIDKRLLRSTADSGS